MPEVWQALGKELRTHSPAWSCFILVSCALDRGGKPEGHGCSTLYMVTHSSSARLQSYPANGFLLDKDYVVPEGHRVSKEEQLGIQVEKA